MIQKEERIGNQRLILGDCREIVATLGTFNAIITDPPYSERTHRGHDTGVGKDKAKRKPLDYAFLTESEARDCARRFNAAALGWIFWLTDHSLARVIEEELVTAGRYVFAPIPFVQPGRSVRLTGDGPSSWTDWAVVARTAKQAKWGTLPGVYIAKKGDRERMRMGGKPLSMIGDVVSDYTRRGDTVLDPYLGAGTTAVACQKLGRFCTGIEIDPEAFDVACKRVEDVARQRSMFEHMEDHAEQTEIDL